MRVFIPARQLTIEAAYANSMAEPTVSTGNPGRNTNPNADEIRTYVNVASTNQFLNKANAIVFNAIEGTKQITYIEEIAKLTDPSSIRAAFRMSGNRFCIFFNSKNVADEIVRRNKFVTIGNYRIELRKLINPARRIIISNICPSIPHKIIKDELDKLKITLLTEISFLRAGFQDNRFNHIISNRRQFHVNPDQVSLLPPSLLINYDNTAYRIFLAEEGVLCFTCKQQGHISSQCTEQPEKMTPKIPEINVKPQDSTIDESFQPRVRVSQAGLITAEMTPPPVYENFPVTRTSTGNDEEINSQPLDADYSATSKLTSIKIKPQVINTEPRSATPSETSMEIDPVQGNKRPLRRESNSTTNTEKPNTKKAKAEQSQPIKDQKSEIPQKDVDAIMKYCESNAIVPDGNDIIEFINDLSQTPAGQTAHLIEQYSPNKSQFLTTLAEIKGIIKHKSTRNRLTRCINKNATSPADEDNDADLPPPPASAEDFLLRRTNL